MVLVILCYLLVTIPFCPLAVHIRILCVIDIKLPAFICKIIFLFIIKLGLKFLLHEQVNQQIVHYFFYGFLKKKKDNFYGRQKKCGPLLKDIMLPLMQTFATQCIILKQKQPLRDRPFFITYNRIWYISKISRDRHITRQFF